MCKRLQAESTHRHARTHARWTVYFRYRTWAEWMLSIPLCCAIVAIPPHIHTHSQGIFVHRMKAIMLSQEVWYRFRENESQCLVCVCVCVLTCMWECSTWPADSLPSEILSEDYKTNQCTMIAAASLWLDHNPAAAISSAKRKNERGEERDAGQERNEKRDKERCQREPSGGWKRSRRQDGERA